MFVEQESFPDMGWEASLKVDAEYLEGLRG
jgi:hypothetical protein